MTDCIVELEGACERADVIIEQQADILSSLSTIQSLFYLLFIAGIVFLLVRWVFRLVADLSLRW